MRIVVEFEVDTDNLDHAMSEVMSRIGTRFYGLDSEDPSDPTWCGVGMRESADES